MWVIASGGRQYFLSFEEGREGWRRERGEGGMEEGEGGGGRGGEGPPPPKLLQSMCYKGQGLYMQSSRSANFTVKMLANSLRKKLTVASFFCTTALALPLCGKQEVHRTLLTNLDRHVVNLCPRDFHKPHPIALVIGCGLRETTVPPPPTAKCFLCL